MERLPAPAGFFGRLLATVATLIVGVGLFMFSIVVFGVILFLGLGFWAYFWWKTRGLRRALREQMIEPDIHPDAKTTNSPAASTNPTIIEGEYVRLDENGRELPRRDQ